MNRRVVLLFVALIVLPSAIRAQSTPTSGVPAVVTKVPFTAQEWTTASYLHPDGTSTTTVHRTDVYRNSSGSTRREVRILPSNSTTAQPTGSASIEIHDIPNGLAIHLTPASATGTIATIGKPTARTVPVGIPGGATVTGAAQDIGLRSIGGYTASGTRLNLSYPASSRSPNPYTGTMDTWYSPDLQTVLLVEVNDSLGNSRAIALQQIAPGEPDPNLFTVPTTYTTTAAPKPPSVTPARSN